MPSQSLQQYLTKVLTSQRHWMGKFDFELASMKKSFTIFFVIWLIKNLILLCLSFSSKLLIFPCQTKLIQDNKGNICFGTTLRY